MAAVAVKTHAYGPAAVPGDPLIPDEEPYHIIDGCGQVPDTRELFFHMYTSSGVLLLLEVGTKQNKRSSILNQRELKKTHGAEAVKKMRQEMIGFLPRSVRGKHGQFHTFTERFLIEDESHPAVKQNKTKLRHLKVHMAGESGLRAKQDLWPFQLLGSYYGEVCTQEEYDSNKIYDWRRGDNLRDDKTKTLWEDAGQDPAKELVVVANVANNPLAFLNDPLGTGHAANVIDVLAWDGDKKELHILIFAGPKGAKKGEELFIDYGPEFRRHMFHDEPARHALILELQEEIEGLQSKVNALTEERQTLLQAHEGSTGAVQALQAEIEQHEESLRRAQAAAEAASEQHRSALSAAQEDLQKGASDWADERKVWRESYDERGTDIQRLEGELRQEKRLRERDNKTAVWVSAQVQKDAEDEVAAMRMQLQAAVRPAHEAHYQVLREATSTLRSQLAVERTKLQDAHQKALRLEMALSNAKEECAALSSENARLKKDKDLAESRYASEQSMGASMCALAEAQAAAEKATAQAALSEAQNRQLAAQLSVKNAELKICRLRRSEEESQHAAAAAETRKLRSSLAERDAARAAAQQAGRRCAALMTKDDADLRKISADLERLCEAVEAAGVQDASPELQQCMAMLTGCRISPGAAEAPADEAECIELSSSSSEHAAEGDEMASADTAGTQVEADTSPTDEAMPDEGNTPILERAEQPYGHDKTSPAKIPSAKQKPHADVASNTASLPQHQSYSGDQHGRSHSASTGARPHKDTSAESHGSQYQQGHSVWPGDKACAWSGGPQYWWQAPQTQQSSDQQQGQPERAAWPGNTRPQHSMAAGGQHRSDPQFGETYCGSSQPWPPKRATAEAQPEHSGEESEEFNIDKRRKLTRSEKKAKKRARRADGMQYNKRVSELHSRLQETFDMAHSRRLHLSDNCKRGPSC